MKRHIHPLNNPNITLWEAICSIDNIRLAHKNAKRGKGWYKEVQEINKDPEKYFKILQDMLINKTYKTSKYEIFIKNDSGKEREIFKLPYFPDRVCQWATIQVIEPILILTFTRDTYSSIPNKGIHSCLNKVKKDINADLEGTKYCLKLDITKFYPSINHDILNQKYYNLFKDNDLLWLINEIIDSTDGDTGIPIGNYFSQYSGNLYLSSFDHWVKENLHIKYYYRYMDDIVILMDSKEKLHDIKLQVTNYLETNLLLKVKDNWQIFPTAVRGIDFVGYRIFPKYTLLRKSTCKKFKIKVKSINRKIKNNKKITYSDFCSINSYKGWLKHCNSYRLTQKYLIPI